jgi:hypothetical protein
VLDRVTTLSGGRTRGGSRFSAAAGGAGGGAAAGVCAKPGAALATSAKASTNQLANADLTHRFTISGSLATPAV